MTSTRVGGPGARALDPDEVAALEEERDHLLASLEDLERERAAGDLDPLDYETLRDDYTARAAEVLRALEEHRQLVRRSTPRRSPVRTALVAVAVLGFAVVAGVVVAQAAGQRGGGTLTGNDDTLRARLANCQPLAFRDPARGVRCYREILESSPDNVEALTYLGWALIRDDRVAEGARQLDRAVELDPDYPDVRVFRAVVAARAAEAAAARGDRASARAGFEQAAGELDRFYRNDPPEIAVQVLREELLEFKVFLGLLEPSTARCWATALGARGGDVALDQRLYDDLGVCADGLLAASPDDPDALFTRALAFIGPDRQDVRAALGLVERLLAVEPSNANGLLLRASLALAERRADDARADLDALSALPRPTASFLLGSPDELRRVLDRLDGVPPQTAPTGGGSTPVPNPDGG